MNNSSSERVEKTPGRNNQMILNRSDEVEKCRIENNSYIKRFSGHYKMIRHKSFTRKSGSSRRSIQEDQERTRVEADSFVNTELLEDNLIGFSESALMMPGLLSFIVCTTVWYKDINGG